MNISIDMTSFMSVTKTKNLFCHRYTLYNKSLAQVTSYKYLGAILSSGLKKIYYCHVEYIRYKTLNKLWYIWKSIHHAPTNVEAQAYSSDNPLNMSLFISCPWDPRRPYHDVRTLFVAVTDPKALPSSAPCVSKGFSRKENTPLLRLRTRLARTTHCLATQGWGATIAPLHRLPSTGNGCPSA